MGLLVKTTCCQYPLQHFSSIFPHFLYPMLLFWWLCFSFQRQVRSYQSKTIENCHCFAPLQLSSCSYKIQKEGLSIFQQGRDCSLLWPDVFICPYHFDLIGLKRSLDWLFGLLPHFMHHFLKRNYRLLLALWNCCCSCFVATFVSVFCTFFFSFLSCRLFRDCKATLIWDWTSRAGTTILSQDSWTSGGRGARRAAWSSPPCRRPSCASPASCGRGRRGSRPGRGGRRSRRRRWSRRSRPCGRRRPWGSAGPRRARRTWARSCPWRASVPGSSRSVPPRTRRTHPPCWRTFCRGYVYST